MDHRAAAAGQLDAVLVPAMAQPLNRLSEAHAALCAHGFCACTQRTNQNLPEHEAMRGYR